MITAQVVTQLKAFARQDGFFLSLVWISAFAASIYLPQSSIGSLLTLSTPFFVAWRLKEFRDYALEGTISFRRSFAYVFYTFFYAALIFAVAQMLYLRFLDHGSFMTMFDNAMQVLTPIYQEQGMSTQDITAAMDMLKQSTPVELAFVFMLQNIFFGTIIGLPIAAICKKRPHPTTTE